MSLNKETQNGSFAHGMQSLNLDIPELTDDFSTMDYRQLADAKRLVETSLDHLFSQLHETHNFDMDSPLIIDGFPRSDVDVVTIRLLRSKIVRLRNDHRTILKLLQDQLERQLQVSTDYAGHVATKNHEDNTKKDINAHLKVFALVRDVVTDSPAERAGLLIGDKILTFDGNIHHQNHNKLLQVAARVKEKKDMTISVEVLRDSSWHTLSLTPTDNWPGKGLLGCHIVPI